MTSLQPPVSFLPLKGLSSNYPHGEGWAAFQHSTSVTKDHASDIDGWSPQRHDHGTFDATLLTCLSIYPTDSFFKLSQADCFRQSRRFVSFRYFSFPSLLSPLTTSGLRTCFGDWLKFDTSSSPGHNHSGTANAAVMQPVCGKAPQTVHQSVRTPKCLRFANVIPMHYATSRHAVSKLTCCLHVYMYARGSLRLVTAATPCDPETNWTREEKTLVNIHVGDTVNEVSTSSRGED